MNPRILIADDNAVDCMTMALTLGQTGDYATEVANSGAGIRERLRLRQFDLIILDYHLDDGVAEPLLRLAESRQRKAQILMVSGDAALSGFAHRLSPRVIGFIHKGPDYARALAASMAVSCTLPRRRSRPVPPWRPDGTRRRAPLAPSLGVLGTHVTRLPFASHLSEG